MARLRCGLVLLVAWQLGALRGRTFTVFQGDLGASFVCFFLLWGDVLFAKPNGNQQFLGRVVLREPFRWLELVFKGTQHETVKPSPGKTPGRRLEPAAVAPCQGHDVPGAREAPGEPSTAGES